MTSVSQSDSVRPQRADAQRNRALLLEVAALAFAREKDVTLEAIAREAGVGIGTLYRHFPTRDALVEATYRNQLDRVCDAAAELLSEHAPDVALREWMNRFIDFIMAKRGMSDALRTLCSSGSDPFGHSRERLRASIAELLEAGSSDGTVRADVEAGDVLTSLSGVVLAAGAPDQREQAGRLLDLLMDGLRHRANNV